MDKDPRSHPNMPTKPHDALFKKLLESEERAGAVLREYLPAEIVTRLAPDPPRLMEGTFVSEALRHSQADRLFEVKLTEGTPVLVYALLEHKSTPDKKTPLQLAGYMMDIWKRYTDEHPDQWDCLPVIIPMVFYHGASDWNVPLSLFDMMDDDTASGLTNRAMRYILCDIGKMAPAD